MLRLANQVIDAYDDVGMTGIQKLAKAAPHVCVMTPAERASLSDTDFALSIITKKAAKLNKYPIDTQDNTWLSNQYFDMNHHRLPKTAAHIAAYNIKRACEEFDVKAAPAVVGLAKEASSNVYFEEEQKEQTRTPVRNVDLSKFANIDDICENYTAAQYAFSTPTHIKLACKYFEDYSEKLPLEQRHKYAAAIQRRSHELGMGHQKGVVEKYASDHYSPQLDAHISARRSLLEVAEPKLLAGLNKLATMKKELSPSEFARTLHAFDKKANLNRYYGGHLLDPYLATFASEPDPYLGYRYKTANHNLQANEIQALAHAKYARIKEYFGHSIADEFKKDPIPIFDSLPNDAKELMAGIANGTL